MIDMTGAAHGTVAARSSRNLISHPSFYRIRVILSICMTLSCCHYHPTSCMYSGGSERARGPHIPLCWACWYYVTVFGIYMTIWVSEVRISWFHIIQLTTTIVYQTLYRSIVNHLFKWMRNTDSADCILCQRFSITPPMVVTHLLDIFSSKHSSHDVCFNKCISCKVYWTLMNNPDELGDLFWQTWVSESKVIFVFVCICAQQLDFNYEVKKPRTGGCWNFQPGPILVLKISYIRNCICQK